MVDVQWNHSGIKIYKQRCAVVMNPLSRSNTTTTETAVNTTTITMKIRMRMFVRILFFIFLFLNCRIPVYTGYILNVDNNVKKNNKLAPKDPKIEIKYVYENLT